MRVWMSITTALYPSNCPLEQQAAGVVIRRQPDYWVGFIPVL